MRGPGSRPQPPLGAKRGMLREPAHSSRSAPCAARASRPRRRCGVRRWPQACRPSRATPSCGSDCQPRCRAVAIARIEPVQNFLFCAVFDLRRNLRLQLQIAGAISTVDAGADLTRARPMNAHDRHYLSKLVNFRSASTGIGSEGLLWSRLRLD